MCPGYRNNADTHTYTHTRTGPIAQTYLCKKIQIGLGHTKLSRRQISLSRNLQMALMPQFEYGIMCTDVVDTASHYKYFSLLCPSKLHSSSASLVHHSLLWSSHTQLLFSPFCLPFFFSTVALFFFFALFLTWNTEDFFDILHIWFLIVRLFCIRCFPPAPKAWKQIRTFWTHFSGDSSAWKNLPGSFSLWGDKSKHGSLDFKAFLTYLSGRQI